MATNPNSLLTPLDLAVFHEAERIGGLRSSPEFNKILLVHKSLVEVALKALEDNRQPYLTAELTLRWQERKFVYDYINQYIDSVIAKRRDKVRELFEAAGLDAETIDRNLDASLDFLSPKGNGHANPNAADTTE